MKKIILLSIVACVFALNLNGQAKLKVTEDGVGIDSDAPEEQLHIRNSGTAAAFLVERADKANYVRCLAGQNGSTFFFTENKFFSLTPASSKTDNTVDFPNALTIYGPAHGSFPGRVGIGTNSPTHKLHVQGSIKYTGALVPSDERLKSDVRTFDRGLDAVMQLNPITYKYNGKGGTTTGSQNIGVLAQNLKKVAPELVQEYTHVVMGENQSIDEPNPVKSKENFLEIRDNEVKYLLINAIKDQQQIIEEKEERITVLEEKIAKIEEFMATIGSTKDINTSATTLSGKNLAQLKQNQPNPFNESTKIGYFIPVNVKSAAINVYNNQGMLLKVVDINHIGEGELTLNIDNLPNGTYNYQLIVDGKSVQTNQMILTK